MTSLAFPRGEVRFVDCIEGMKELPDKSFDIGFADPPFNINLETNPNHGRVFYRVREGAEFYDDLMARESYVGWCATWLQEMRRACVKTFIYCGNVNLPAFYSIAEPLDQLAYFMKFNTITTATAWAGRYRVVLIYADSKKPFCGAPKGQNNKFDSNIIVKTGRFDASERAMRAKLIHPCPIDKELEAEIIRQMKPSSMLDPFLGSGTTAEVCEESGVRWLGFEIKEEYAPDITMRANAGHNAFERRDGKQQFLF